MISLKEPHRPPILVGVALVSVLIGSSVLMVLYPLFVLLSLWPALFYAFRGI